MNHLHEVLLSRDLLNNREWPEFENCLLPDQQFTVAALTLRFQPPRGSVAEQKKRHLEYTRETLAKLGQIFDGKIYAMFVALSQPPTTRLFEYLGIWRNPGVKTLLNNIEKGEVARIQHADHLRLAGLAKFGPNDLDVLTECISIWGSVFPFVHDRPLGLSPEVATAMYQKIFRKNNNGKQLEPPGISWPHVAYHAAESDLLCVRFDSSLNTYGVLFDVYGRQETVEKIYLRFASDDPVH
jgi:hypothetical protein